MSWLLIWPNISLTMYNLHASHQLILSLIRVTLLTFCNLVNTRAIRPVDWVTCTYGWPGQTRLNAWPAVFKVLKPPNMESWKQVTWSETAVQSVPYLHKGCQVWTLTVSGHYLRCAYKGDSKKKTSAELRKGENHLTKHVLSKVTVLSHPVIKLLPISTLRKGSF